MARALVVLVVLGSLTGAGESDWRYHAKKLPAAYSQEQLRAAGPDAFGAVLKALRSKDVAAREAAIQILIEYAAKLETVEPFGSALLAALRDKSARVRAGAAQMLREKAGPKNINGLIRALPSKYADARDAAAGALGRIGPPAVPLLVELLDKPSNRRRLYAIRALGYAGPVAAAHVDRLVALRDAVTDKPTRREIGRALARIGAPPETLVPMLLRDLDDDPASAPTTFATIAELGTRALPPLATAEPSVRVGVALRALPASVAIAYAKLLAEAPPEKRVFLLRAAPEGVQNADAHPWRAAFEARRERAIRTASRKKMIAAARTGTVQEARDAYAALRQIAAHPVTGGLRSRAERYAAEPEIQAMVDKALVWLAGQQRADDGGWEAAAPGCDVGATGLALLAFLGAGYGPGDGHRFSKNVTAGLAHLTGVQDAKTGAIGRTDVHSHTLQHAIATTALMEGWAMRGDYGKQARRALAHLLALRNPEGTWGYRPRGFTEPHTTVWAVQALHAAELAGYRVEARPRIEAAFKEWQRRFTDPNFGCCGYDFPGGQGARPVAGDPARSRPPKRGEFKRVPRGNGRIPRIGEFVGGDPADGSPTLTAGVIWVRYLLDADARENKLVKLGAKLVGEVRADAKSGEFVFWFFAGHVNAHVRESAADWIMGMRKMQQADGAWPAAGRWGDAGGQTCATASAALSLLARVRLPSHFHEGLVEGEDARVIKFMRRAPEGPWWRHALHHGLPFPY